MSLLFFDSMNDPIIAPKPEWSSGAWAQAGTGRDGRAAGAAGNNNSGATLLLPTTAATCIVGFATESNGNIGTANMVLVGFQNGGLTQLILWVNASGFIEVRRTSTSGTLLGTSSGHAPILALTWCHIAAKAVLHTSAGSCVVQLNGVTVLTISGAVTSSVSGPVVSLFHSVPNVGSSGIWWMDDYYVCDAVDATATQGVPNNDFLGDLRVAALMPSAAGDTTQWTPSTGANWDAVNEFPPNTTDYVSDNVSGHRDLYNLTDLPGVVTSVYGVRTGYYVSKTDAGQTFLKPVIKENSVATVDTLQGLSYGSWGPVHSRFWWLRPSDSTPWTVATVAAMQAGMEVG